jgi:Uma2 family endonuclease
MKLRVEAANAYLYPDVVVTCDARDRADDLCKRYPSLIVEVLSDGTAAYDRGQKFASIGFRTPLAALFEDVEVGLQRDAEAVRQRAGTRPRSRRFRSSPRPTVTGPGRAMPVQ